MHTRLAFDVTFNTGRRYTARGQVIRAVATQAGAIFSDFSRCISGAVEIEPCYSKRDFESAVLREYDAGRYSYDHAAACLRDISSKESAQ